MATVAGYSMLFLVDERVKQITIADRDERAIEHWLSTRYGPIKILARTPLDAKALGLMELGFGQWMEWAPLARRS
jgi:hypothetical protein